MKSQIRKILTLLMILAGVTTTVFAQEGFGINKPAASAAWDVTSTTKGFLPPRMSDAQMAAIASPAEGLMVFNTTRHCMMYYSSGAWISTSVISSAQLPVASAVSVSGSLVVGGVLTASYTYSQAIGIAAGTPIYQWYFSSTGVNGTQAEVPGGTVNPYKNTVGVGKYVAVGVTPVSSTGVRGTEVMSPWYLVGCPPTMTVYHTYTFGAAAIGNITYKMVSTTLGGTGAKCWITQDLGADQEATSLTDDAVASSGWYWEFNQGQGFNCDGGTYFPGVWITLTPEISNWSLSKDPCALELGAGWRLPTKTEWSNVIANGGWTTNTSTYASVLKLHNAGVVGQAAGLVYRGSAVGGSGYYWSSTQRDTQYGYMVFIWPGGCVITTQYKDAGCSVRCLQD